MMLERCLYCGRIAAECHHVVKRSECGSDNTENLAPLCRACHHAIHHGRDTEYRDAVLKKCYDFIKPNLDKCYTGKIKPKIINILESVNNKS